MVYTAIQKYGWDNIQKEIIECQSEEEMDTLEIELIKKYQTTDIHFGYNLEAGGHFTRHRSDQTKKKISETLKGKTYNSKPVICIETGEVFSSAHLAAEAYNLKSCNSITNVCNKKKYYKTAGGFHWAWYQEEEKST